MNQFYNYTTTSGEYPHLELRRVPTIYEPETTCMYRTDHFDPFHSQLFEGSTNTRQLCHNHTLNNVKTNGPLCVASACTKKLTIYSRGTESTRIKVRNF
jgi:hypothetical protein